MRFNFYRGCQAAVSIVKLHYFVSVERKKNYNFWKPAAKKKKNPTFEQNFLFVPQ